MRLSDDRIRWDISMIIVAFPLFFFTFRAVTRAVAKDPTKRASRPRKWLTYLTLFVAGTALVGDTAVLIYNMLGGELTCSSSGRSGYKARVRTGTCHRHQDGQLGLTMSPSCSHVIA